MKIEKMHDISKAIVDKQIKALQESCMKWWGIMHFCDEDTGCNGCECCIQFPSQSCTGCPIMESTGYFRCLCTPYTEWAAYKDIPCGANDRKDILLARAEYKFLVGVLNNLIENNSVPNGT